MYRKFAFLLLALLAFAVVSLPASVIYAEEKAEGKEGEDEKEFKPEETDAGIMLNFEGYDLRKAIEYLSRKLKKPIIFSDGFGGTVNYISFVPIPKENLLPVFETILNLNGWQMVEVAGMIKIVAMQQGAGVSTSFKTDKEREALAARDRIITQVFKLQYLDSNSAIATLSNFLISRNIVAIEHANSIIITGFESEILRIATVLNEVDIPGPKITHKVITLKFASVDTLGTYLDAYIKTMASSPVSSSPIQSGRRPAGQPGAQPAGGATSAYSPVAIADSRTNSFIIIGTEDNIQQIEEFIKSVDLEATSAGNYHVFPLKNINAKDIATTLNEAVSKAYAGKQTPNDQQPVIIAFESQNALIILASASKFEEIKKLVENLDVPQKQVLIRTVIVEVSTSKMREIGIELASGDFPTSDGYRGFGSTFGTTNKYVVPGVSTTYPGGTGLTLGVIRDRSGVWAIPALLQAVQRDKDIDLLAEPQILATDNEKASLTISEKIPYSTISSTSTTTTSSTATYGGDYEASIKLTITPHISSTEYLTLEIEQTVEQFFKSEFTFDTVSGTEANRPSKTVREAKTKIGVESGKCVVIGGLTRNKTDETVSKIPWLGDIPGIGHLFRKASRSVEKVNLYIFLQPEIITNPDDLERVSNLAHEKLDVLRKSRLNRDKLAKTVFKNLEKDEPKPTETTPKSPAEKATPPTDPSNEKSRPTIGN